MQDSAIEPPLPPPPATSVLQPHLTLAQILYSEQIIVTILHGCGWVILWFVMATEMDIVCISAGTHFVTEVAWPPFSLHMFGFHVVFHVLPGPAEMFTCATLEAGLCSFAHLAV